MLGIERDEGEQCLRDVKVGCATILGSDDLDSN